MARPRAPIVKRPRKPWTTATTPAVRVKAMGTSPVRSNLCTPLIAVSTAVRSSHKENVLSTAVDEKLKQKLSSSLSPAPPPCS